MANNQGKNRAGRPKGSIPKKSQELIAILDAHNYSPVADLIYWSELAKKEFQRFKDAIQNGKLLESDSFHKTDAVQWAKTGISASLGILPYIYPKRKPIEGQAQLTPDKVEKMPTHELVAMAKREIEDLEQFDESGEVQQ